MQIVFIVADSVRHDAFGCCGGTAKTPTVDALANDGIQYTHVVSAAPWTVPSVASMLTGIFSHKLGLAKWEQPLPEKYPSVFDCANKQGIKVASFVFDQTHLFRNTPEANVQGSSQQIDSIIHWLQENKHESFFLFIHYWWTHVPYVAKPMNIRSWRQATDKVLEVLRSGEKGKEAVRILYRRSIEYFSEQWLPSILGELSESDPWIFLTADHGESWGERPETAALTDVFDLHGNTLYDEVIRVPLIVKPPASDSIPTNRRIDDLVRTVDLAPTLDSLLASNLLTNNPDLDGISLLPTICDGNPLPKLNAISAMNLDFVDKPNLPEKPEDLWCGLSITDQRYKQIWFPQSGKHLAFDLDSDPGEKTNIVDKTPELFTGGRKFLESEFQKAQIGSLKASDQIAIANRLRALGYLD